MFKQQQVVHYEVAVASVDFVLQFYEVKLSRRRPSQQAVQSNLEAWYTGTIHLG